LVKDKATKLPKLNCRNWECGVVIPVRTQREIAAGRASSVSGQKGEINASGSDGSQKARRADAAGGPVHRDARNASASMNIFPDVAPVPMVLPGEEYGTRRPWFYHER